MDTQILTKPATICSFFVTLPEADFPPSEPICASSLDYGFDFDQEEVAADLLGPLPVSLISQAGCEVDAQEFESRHLWFLS